MSHLLAIAVGPVQEFIAAARRTRDLWFGSHLLSQVSRAVATAVEQHGSLIFPATSVADNVANVILAELKGGADPKAVAATAKHAARDCWKQFAEEARGITTCVIRNDIWDSQVDDVVEFYAAWVPRTEDYQQDRARVMRLLAGRKNCREFLPANGLAGVPKSSLDGQRETVLKDGNRENWTKRLRLSPGEQLDVVGVVKRLAGGNKPYPSVARVAAETWLSGLNEDEIATLKAACESVDKLNKVAEPNYQYFPFEGTIIYKDRHPDLIVELGEATREPLKKVAEILSELGGEPMPYLAVIVADGDSMGRKLSEFQEVKEHREFSAKLASFSKQAKEVVEKHSGVLVYAGGDDVLAFAPVHTCLQCARDLRNKFHDTTGMTLSVGIAIGHFMENLEDLREYGQRAEKAAKGVEGKDALAIHLHKRGGASIQVRAKWNDEPDKRLAKFAELMNDGTIPTKLPYELRAMATLYETWLEANATAAIKADLPRLIAKKSSKKLETVAEAMEDYIVGMTSEKLRVLAQELLVARQLAEAIKQAGGKS